MSSSSVTELHECPICSNVYDTDPSLLHTDDPNLLEKIRKNGVRLPVTCQKCPYTCCYECIKHIQVADAEKRNGRVLKTVACSSCGKSQAFHVAEPKINMFACQLLEEVIAALPKTKKEEDEEETNLQSKSTAAVAPIASRTKQEPKEDPENINTAAVEDTNQQPNQQEAINDDNSISSSSPGAEPALPARAIKQDTSEEDEDITTAEQSEKRKHQSTPLSRPNSRKKQKLETPVEELVEVAKGLKLPSNARFSGFDGLELHMTESNLPKSFQAVIHLMDFLFQVAPGEDTFHQALWLKAGDNKETRLGIKTRVQLRKIKQKDPNGPLDWHKSGAEYAPSTKDDLEKFVRILMNLKTAPKLTE